MNSRNIFILSLLFIIGCEKFATKSNSYDDDLITSIIESEKISIDLSDLPNLSRSVIEQDYYDYKEIDASMASGFGYQVLLDRKNFKPGQRNEVFFNMEGRKLIPKMNKYKSQGLKCFEIVLPANFIMPDETTIKIETEEDYSNLKLWYENNTSIEKPELEFPIDVIFEYGIDKNEITKEIYDINDMVSLKEYCNELSFKNNSYWDCFRLEYPITFLMYNGSEIIMEDEKDWSEIKQWYEQNPDSEKPNLNYPVNIIYKDGTSEMIENEEMMLNLKQNCNN